MATAWHMASEHENRGFIVQRSHNGHDFTAISGLVAGTNSAPHTYTGADWAAPKQLVHYRVLQLDYDGTSQYSSIVALGPAADIAPALTLWPNPATDVVRVSGATGGPLELFDATGRVVRMVHEPTATTDLDLRGLPNGVYTVRCGAQVQRLLVE